MDFIAYCSILWLVALHGPVQALANSCEAMVIGSLSWNQLFSIQVFNLHWHGLIIAYVFLDTFFSLKFKGVISCSGILRNQMPLNLIKFIRKKY